MIKFFRLMLLRPVERFLAQVIAISTTPSAFVKERIRLGDTTNFIRAGGFFLSAISTAFLAEVATLHLLGIGDLAEPYYWLFILLTSIPFVLSCFLLLRLVAPLSFKDVLHLSFHPIGAGVFSGAAFVLVASAVIGLLASLGFIPEIRYDFTQWGDEAQAVAVNKAVLRDCLKQNSLIYTIVAAGLRDAYEQLKPPIDIVSYLGSIIGALYLLVLAWFFTAAVHRRKVAVFSMVLLAAFVATGVNVGALAYYLDWNFKASGCEENLPERGVDRMAESALKDLARRWEQSATDNDILKMSVRAEGRTVAFTYRAKKPIVNFDAFDRGIERQQKEYVSKYCSDEAYQFLRWARVTMSHTYYSVDGARLIGFSVGPADCPKW